MLGLVGGMSGGMGLLGPALAAGGTILQAKGAKEDREAAIQMNRENIALQREFAQHGVRWRKEDAEAAGLHPLFALGGAGSTFSPSAVTVGDSPKAALGRGLQSMGQDVTRAALAMASPEERQEHAARLALLGAQVGEADARRQLILAQMHKLQQDGVATRGTPSSEVVQVFPVSRDGSGAGMPEARLATDHVKLEAAEQRSVNSRFPSRSAAVNAFYDEHRIDDQGHTVLMPNQQLGEILESAPFWVRWATWLETIRRNYEHVKNRQSQQIPKKK